MLNCKTFSKKRASKRSAFTLIELSIVLIIIGLLVAGVTGGASLIRSAQLRSVMSEARGFNVAVNAFVVQYDSLPGDYGTPIGDGLAGDANGKIEYLNAVASPNVAEGLNAWLHLIESNTIDESLSGYTALDQQVTGTGTFVSGVIGQDYPKSKLDGVGWTFDYSTDRNVVIATGTVPDVANTLTTAQNMVAVGAITPSDSLSIDTKLDDGEAHAGRVQGSALLATSTNCFISAVGPTQGDYVTGTATEVCALEFTVDIS